MNWYIEGILKELDSLMDKYRKYNILLKRKDLPEEHKSWYLDAKRETVRRINTLKAKLGKDELV